MLTISTVRRAMAGIVIGAAVLTSNAAFGGAIVQPSGISSPQGNFGGAFALVNMINQSGLSIGYTSGVTDFTTYTAATTHSSPGSVNSGFTAGNGIPQQFSFDLGALTGVSAIAFWPVSNVGSVATFELFVDTDAIFGNGVGASLGVFNSLGASDPSPAQIFNFAATVTQYIHLEGTAPASLTLGIGEVAFETAAVPEPATLTLFGLGLLGLGAARRRKKLAA